MVSMSASMNLYWRSQLVGECPQTLGIYTSTDAQTSAVAMPNAMTTETDRLECLMRLHELLELVAWQSLETAHANSLWSGGCSCTDIDLD